MIATWVFVVILILFGIGGAVACACSCDSTGGKIGGAIACMLLALALSGGLLWKLYGTESGARTIKSFQSEVFGGITRNVRVFDMDGDMLAEYTGRFDIENRTDSIMFDDENGKRHVIYFSTGTIIVDEL